MPPRLRVGLDVSPLALTRAGAARYIDSLLAALPEGRGGRAARYGFGGSSRPLVPVRDVGWYLGALPLRARRDGARRAALPDPPRPGALRPSRSS